MSADDGAAAVPRGVASAASAADKRAVLALLQQQRWEALAQAARALTRRHPADGFGWSALGLALRQAGADAAEALAAVERAAQLLPADGDAAFNLALAYLERRRFAEAESWHRRTLALQPDRVEAWNNLGCVLMDLERHGEAEPCLRQALALQPGFALAHRNLGKALYGLGRLAEAGPALQQSLALAPHDADSWNLMGMVLRGSGRMDQAQACFEQALAIQPQQADAAINLANTLSDQGRLLEAEAAYGRALALAPEFAPAHNNLGNALSQLGRHDEAEAAYRRAIALSPDYLGAWSNLLFLGNYHPDRTAAQVFEDFQAYERRFGAPLAHGRPAPANSRRLDRRLRLGFVSPDFRAHTCAHFVEPLFAHLDRSAFELFAYAELEREDAFSERFRALVDHWIPTRGLHNDALAQRIREHGIDVLVDLAGHTAGNRLLAFARKPAPVAASWLGFGTTTGLRAMDWFLTDAVCVPPGSEALFSETPWRLPVAWAYRPPAGMGEPGPLPALASGRVTFGTLTRAVRINHRTVRVWSQILHRVPHARLVIDSRSFQSPQEQERMAAAFAAHGIARERLHIGCHSPPWDVLRGIDIGLDCFPHNSGTTLFESLYLGVPYVTLRERPGVGRMGAAILHAVGEPGWCADSEQQYIEIAVARAADLPALAALRGGLRARMRASPLMDEAGFARAMGEALRGMFARWAARQ